MGSIAEDAIKKHRKHDESPQGPGGPYGGPPGPPSHNGSGMMDQLGGYFKR